MVNRQQVWEDVGKRLGSMVADGVEEGVFKFTERELRIIMQAFANSDDDTAKQRESLLIEQHHCALEEVTARYEKQVAELESQLTDLNNSCMETFGELQGYKNAIKDIFG